MKKRENPHNVLNVDPHCKEKAENDEYFLIDAPFTLNSPVSREEFEQKFGKLSHFFGEEDITKIIEDTPKEDFQKALKASQERYKHYQKDKNKKGTTIVDYINQINVKLREIDQIFLSMKREFMI